MEHEDRGRQEERRRDEEAEGQWADESVRNPIGKIGDGAALAVKKAWGREGVAAEGDGVGAAGGGRERTGELGFKVRIGVQMGYGCERDGYGSGGG